MCVGQVAFLQKFSAKVLPFPQVKTLKSGEMDYEHFKELVTANRARPAIVNVNCGTTVKGAVDDLDRVLAILQECGYSEDRFYIHVDGALFGMMVRPYSSHKCFWETEFAGPLLLSGNYYRELDQARTLPA